MSLLTQLAVKIDPNTVGIPTVNADTASLNNILSIVYYVAGIIAVVVIVIAGLMYTLSAGDAGSTKRAKNAIIYATVGLVVIIMAFTITQFVLGRV